MILLFDIQKQKKIKIQNKNEESIKLKIIAIQLYQENKIISDPYTQNFNKVYLETMMK